MRNKLEELTRLKELSGKLEILYRDRKQVEIIEMLIAERNRDTGDDYFLNNIRQTIDKQLHWFNEAAKRENVFPFSEFSELVTHFRTDIQDAISRIELEVV